MDPRVSGLRPSPKDDREEEYSPKGDREGGTKEGTSFSVMLAKASIQGNVFFMPTAFRLCSLFLKNFKVIKPSFQLWLNKNHLYKKVAGSW